jgi:hypothetical protein
MSDLTARILEVVARLKGRLSRPPRRRRRGSRRTVAGDPGRDGCVPPRGEGPGACDATRRHEPGVPAAGLSAPSVAAFAALGQM